MNHRTLYSMSKNTYLPSKNREYLQGWVGVEHSYDNGLMFIHYRSEATNEDVIAFRGTDMGKLTHLTANLWTHLGLFLGKSPNTAENAIQAILKKLETSFFEDIFAFFQAGAKKQLYFTGHDLGGVLAIYVVAHSPRVRENLKEIIVFETPGCKHLVPPQIDLKLTVYLTSPNFINTSGEQLPNTAVYVPASFREDEGDLLFLCQEKFRHLCHSIINMFASLAMIGLFIDCVMRQFLEKERLTIFLVTMVYSIFSPLLSLIEKVLSVEAGVLLKSALSIVPMNPLERPLKSWLSDLNTDTAFSWMAGLFLVAVYVLIAYQEWDRLMKQHPIKAMDNRFSAAPQENGLPQNAIRMASWPTKNQLLLHDLSSPLQFFNPLSRLRVFFSSAKQIELERNKRIAGFVEKEDPVHFRPLHFNR